jgi:tetratricopeptide (TPR) repeat protein
MKKDHRLLGLSFGGKNSAMFRYGPCARLVVYSLLITHCSLLSSLSAQEVQWRTNYSLARKEALATNRPLLLDFGTEQCFWCRNLDATTFRDAQVVLLLNEKFVPLKINAASDPRLTEALHIRSFPTMVIAAPDGKILSALEGYRQAAVLQEHLQRILAGLHHPDALAQAYEEATKAAAAADYAHARALLKNLTEQGMDPSLQVKAKQLLNDLDEQDLHRQGRVRQARELLAQAREDYRTQQYLCCWDRCARLAASFADLPEGTDGVQLAKSLQSDPQRLQQACDSLSDRLAGLYLALAEACIQKNQTQQAARYLERVLQVTPETPQAETARLRLSDLQSTTLSRQ